MSQAFFAGFRDRRLMLLLSIYAGLGPIIVLRLDENLSIGLPDLLAPISMLILISLWSQIQLTALSVIYLSYIVLTVVSSCVAVSTGTPIINLLLTVRLIFIFMPFLLIHQIGKFREAEFQRLLAAFLTGGTVALLVAIILHLAGIEIREQQQRLWLEDSSVSRAAGLTGNTGEFGHLVSLWMLAAVVLTPLVRWRYHAVIQLAGLIGGGYLLLVSASRSGFLHFAGGLAIIAMFWHVRIIARLRFPQLAFIVLGSVALAGGAVLFSDDIQAALLDPAVAGSVERLDVFNLSGRSAFIDETRLGNWPSIIETIGNNPVFGTGFKNYTWKTENFVDNAFISSLLEGGMLAGFMYLIFWIMLILRCLQLSRRDAEYGGAALAFAVSDLSHALTLDVQTLWYSTPIALIMVAGLMRCAETRGRAGAELRGYVRMR